ncbi:MAG TPA: TlpA disulfide reductase family protein [Phnomibacter sp.]|nr:TlpA disulfide reductase family protein [Phnomibacter sp.]
MRYLKLQMVLLAVLLTGMGQAQTKLTIVKGEFNREYAKVLTLYKVHEGAPVSLATLQLDEDKQYAFAVPNIEEGFYYLGDQLKRSYVRMYLKPNDQLELNIDEKEKPTLIKGSAENKVVIDWTNLAFDYLANGDLQTKGMTTYKEFFPMVAPMLTSSKAFSSKINTPNKKFNAIMKLAVQQDVERTAISFLMLPNSVHPTKADYPAEYFEFGKAPKFADGRLMQLAETRRYLSTYITFYGVYMRSPDSMKTPPSKTAIMGLDWIANDTMKGIVVVNNLNRYRTFEEMEEAAAPYKKYLTTPSLQEAYFNALQSVANFKKGSSGYVFAYEDTVGKTVSMKDLKGKVVLVDVWATWCGPCKAEIPHLKKLEEELHGVDVAFVSISTDKEADKEKWKAFVGKEQLGGIQLYAGGPNNGFSQFYQINAIPRFLVFDQQGKIVTVDAPRPSSPDLKKLLLELAGTTPTSAGQ